MEIATGRVDEPGGLGVGDIGRQCSGRAIASDDEFVREVVANAHACGGSKAVLDGVGISREMDRIVVNLSIGRGFERDADIGEPGGAQVGDHVIANNATAMRRITQAKADATITVKDEIFFYECARRSVPEMDSMLGDGA